MTIAEAKAKLVAVARGELGYKEGANNWTKYAADPLIAKLYGWTPQNQPWCGTFANWCYLTAFGYDVGSRLTFGGSAACKTAADYYKAAGAWVHFPEVGDQAFYYAGGAINHTGIVVAVDGSTITAVEGNYSDKVSSVKHNIGASDVAGFGRPCWKIVESEKDEGGGGSGSSDSGTVSDPDTVNHNWRPSLLTTSNMYKDDCVALQAILNCRHFACGSADGFYGPKTQAAVNRFQAWAGLTVDGVCGPKTWKALLKTN